MPQYVLIIVYHFQIILYPTQCKIPSLKNTISHSWLARKEPKFTKRSKNQNSRARKLNTRASNCIFNFTGTCREEKSWHARENGTRKESKRSERESALCAAHERKQRAETVNYLKQSGQMERWEEREMRNALSFASCSICIVSGFCTVHLREGMLTLFVYYWHSFISSLSAWYIKKRSLSVYTCTTDVWLTINWSWIIFIRRGYISAVWLSAEIFS